MCLCDSVQGLVWLSIVCASVISPCVAVKSGIGVHVQFYVKQHELTLYEVDNTEEGLGAFIFGDRWILVFSPHFISSEMWVDF